MQPTVSQEIDRVAAEEPIDAEFVETNSVIRRDPNKGKISMELDSWLEVDRKLHELHGLCEIAIMQRDDARRGIRNAHSHHQVTQTRLVEWKTYASKLERKLHEAHAEMLEMRHAIQRAADTADEALAISPFAFSRKKELKVRVEEIRDV
jgi:hypothetical protein